VERLTINEARSLAVIAQRLDRRPRPTRDRRVTKARLLETIQHLGCVQLDTISVISRSHETVLWSRVGRYDPRLLAELHFPDGALMEYWAHAAALAPITDFPYYRRTMERYRQQDAAPGSWAAENEAVLGRVLAAAREAGTVSSRSFTRAEGPRPEPWAWWGGKPDRRALDHLWSRGDLMVIRRDGFERIYAPTERVLPLALQEHRPSLREEREYFARKALSALGIATAAWVADYFRSGARAQVPRREATKALAELVDAGAAVPVSAAGWAEPAFMAAELGPRLAELREGRGRPNVTTLLSPFDNLVWYRGRTAALFGFDYRLESYTPAEKRRYGYYTLPILRRNRLVGRLDPSFDRRGRRLTVRALHLEPGIIADPALVRDVAGAVADLAGFLGANSARCADGVAAPFATAFAAAMPPPESEAGAETARSSGTG
jgi:uncharacterized protein YcaQ